MSAKEILRKLRGGMDIHGTFRNGCVTYTLTDGTPVSHALFARLLHPRRRKPQGRLRPAGDGMFGTTQTYAWRDD